MNGANNYQIFFKVVNCPNDIQYNEQQNIVQPFKLCDKHSVNWQTYRISNHVECSFEWNDSDYNWNSLAFEPDLHLTYFPTYTFTKIPNFVIKRSCFRFISLLAFLLFFFVLFLLCGGQNEWLKSFNQITLFLFIYHSMIICSLIYFMPFAWGFVICRSVHSTLIKASSD